MCEGTSRLTPWVALGAACLVAACATAPSGYLDEIALAAALGERGLRPNQVVLPYAVTEEMREWARDATGGHLSPEDRLIQLQQNLLDPGRLTVRYEWGYTGTAVEVFQQKKANCLAFTNLFVGMARALQVPVYFLAVSDVESYRREGDLVVISDHIAVGYGELQDRKIFDFSENPPDNYRNFREISDLTAISMFHSNRGAEVLQAGYPEQAVEWLEMAVRIDPSLGNAWVNLGVARRRDGDHKGAEDAYRKALVIDPGVLSAYQNLASLLRLQGRHKEAVAYEETLANTPNRNPFTYISLGDISLLGGRPEEAERLYRRALKLRGNNSEAYAALGQLAVSRGDLRLARKMLRKAEKLDGTAPRTQRLAAQLSRRGGTT